MKKLIRSIYTIVVGLLFFFAFGYKNAATAATVTKETYYDSVASETGNDLLEKLFTITNNEAKTLDYNDAWTAYKNSDTKLGTDFIWDMYSDSNYICGDKHYQGNAISGEGSSYNREHACCQSWYQSASPMVSDIHQLFPVDGYCNTQRNDNLYGVVDKVEWTSTNGSKLGTKTTTLTNSDGVAYTGRYFEPADEYKGDLARAYLYMATRYKDKCGTWKLTSKNAVTGATYFFTDSYPYLTKYAYNLLLEWNYMDPVSDKERTRNDGVFSVQNNRNPYIDHPEYVALVWDNETVKTAYEYTGDFTYTELTVNSTKVANVESMISALPAVEDLTFETRTLVYAAINAYSKLNDLEMAAVSNRDTFLAAVKKAEELEKIGEPNPGNLTFVYDSKNMTTTDTIPAGSTSSFTTTATEQLTAGNSMALTLNGYDNQVITSIGLYMKSNKSSGSGYIEVIAGGETLYSFGNATTPKKFSDSEWNGEYSGVYSYTSFPMNVKIGAGEDCVIRLTSTANSIFCEKISITYNSYTPTAIDTYQKSETKAKMRFNYMQSGTKEKTVYDYALVKDVSQLTEGASVVITSADNTKVLSSAPTSSAKYGGVADITVKDDYIATGTENAYVFTLCKGNTEGSWAFKTSDNKYIGNTSTSTSSTANRIESLDTLADNCSFTITVNAKNEAAIVLVESTVSRNTLRYNSGSSSRFACYVSTTTMKTVSLYVRSARVVDVPNYAFSDLYLQFGNIISKDLIDGVLAQEPTATFGMALSINGKDWVYTAVTLTRVSVADGVATSDPEGDYYQCYVAVPVPEGKYETKVYAKGYVEVDGQKYFTKSKAYSVKELAQAYIDAKIEVELLEGLVE